MTSTALTWTFVGLIISLVICAVNAWRFRERLRERLFDLESEVRNHEVRTKAQQTVNDRFTKEISNLQQEIRRHNLAAGDGVFWRTERGELLRLRDMSNHHILNCIKGGFVKEPATKKAMEKELQRREMDRVWKNRSKNRAKKSNMDWNHDPTGMDELIPLPAVDVDRARRFVEETMRRVREDTEESRRRVAATSKEAHEYALALNEMAHLYPDQIKIEDGKIFASIPDVQPHASADLRHMELTELGKIRDELTVVHHVIPLFRLIEIVNEHKEEVADVLMDAAMEDDGRRSYGGVDELEIPALAETLGVPRDVVFRMLKAKDRGLS